jgi:hypothetical protein
VEAGGYDLEVVWDAVTTAALGLPYPRAADRDVNTLSGGAQKRLVLAEAADRIVTVEVGRTPAEILMTERALVRNDAMAALARYEIAPAGQQARLQKRCSAAWKASPARWSR